MTPWSWLTSNVHLDNEDVCGAAFGSASIGHWRDTLYAHAGWLPWPDSAHILLRGPIRDGRGWSVRIGNNGSDGLLDLSLRIQTPAHKPFRRPS